MVIVIAALAVLVLGGVGAMGFMTTASDAPTGAVVQDRVQHATLLMDGFRYRTEPAVLEAGVPVVMTVDLESVQGCMRDVVIEEFGVRKLVSEGDNTITFTPTKEGTFPVVCSMNMGQGTLTVGEVDTAQVDAQVANSITGNAVQEPSVNKYDGGACGIDKPGGCGCGG